jgi:hypothetical protein
MVHGPWPFENFASHLQHAPLVVEEGRQEEARKAQDHFFATARSLTVSVLLSGPPEHVLAPFGGTPPDAARRRLPDFLTPQV